MTSRSFFLNSEAKEMAQTHNAILNRTPQQDNSDMKEFIDDKYLVNSNQGSQIDGKKTSELRIDDDIILNKRYQRKLNGNQERALVNPLHQNSSYSKKFNPSGMNKAIKIQQNQISLQYKNLDKSVESTEINPSRQTNHNTEATKLI